MVLLGPCINAQATKHQQAKCSAKLNALLTQTKDICLNIITKPQFPPRGRKPRSSQNQMKWRHAFLLLIYMESGLKPQLEHVFMCSSNWAVLFLFIYATNVQFLQWSHNHTALFLLMGETTSYILHQQNHGLNSCSCRLSFLGA